MLTIDHEMDMVRFLLEMRGTSQVANISVFSGFVQLVIAAVANASFSLPLKAIKGWAWENTWLIWTVFSLILFPAAAAVVCCPSILAVYRDSGVDRVLLVAGCGLVWGLAQVLFGLSIEAIGVGLTFSIVLGISAALGSLIPLLGIGRTAGVEAAREVLFGLSLVVGGVAVCAMAGRLRERAQGIRAIGAKPFYVGLGMAVCSGICAAAMNVGVGLGQPIIRAATLRGASADGVVYAVWLPLLLAGSLPNLAYCAYLLQRNHTAGNFGRQHGFKPFPLALLMALLWFFSTALYGIATRHLGHLGVVIAWPVFMSLIVVTASILGIATGEGRSSGKRPVILQLSGMALLVAAVIAFALAQSRPAQTNDGEVRSASESVHSLSGAASDVR